MEIKGNDYPMPVCGCGALEMQSEGDEVLICVGCGVRWELNEERGWEAMVEKEPDITCLIEDCPGLPDVYSPSPGAYAMRCPECFMSGPIKAGRDEAKEAWVDLLSYTSAEAVDEVCEKVETDERAPFEASVQARLGEMRSSWPALNSCEEGATYLKMRLDDFWDWLKAPREQREVGDGLAALVSMAATAQRVAEDRQMIPGVMESHSDETTG